MEQIDKLEEAKEVLNDINELHNRCDFKQEDIAKCYLVEKYGDWLINELEDKIYQVNELEATGEFYEHGYFQYLHYLKEIEKNEVLGRDVMTGKTVVTDAGKNALIGLGKFDNSKYILLTDLETESVNDEI